jgi:hypothetical protein
VHSYCCLKTEMVATTVKRNKKSHIFRYNFRVTDLFTGQEISSGRGNAVTKIEFHCWLRKCILFTRYTTIYTCHIKNSSNYAGRLPFCNSENGVIDSLKHMSQLSAMVDTGLFTQSQRDNDAVSSLNISCLNISRMLSRLHSEFRDTQKEKEML